MSLRQSFTRTYRHAALIAWAFCTTAGAALGASDTAPAPRPISELATVATIRVGKTADWVTVSVDAVWVGSTGPNAVHRIDPKTNRRVASVAVSGEPCAGLATGFGSLWVPLCTQPPSLAKVNLATNQLTALFPVGAAAAEAGITTSSDSIWLVIDAAGSLARIDPVSGAIRQTIHIPPGSYNPLFSDGQIWVTRADGSEITAVDAARGALLATVNTGTHPRFLTAGAGAIWTLNQGDGTLTRIDARTSKATTTIALGTPGHGGDIGFGRGMVFTTVAKFPLSVIDSARRALLCQWAGPGGDSLGVGHDAVWLTDYHGGTIMRIPIANVLKHCINHGVR